MAEVSISEIRAAVQQAHRCEANHVESVPVIERFQGATIFDGLVHVFRLIGHPVSDRCYAWARSSDGAVGRTRFVALLHDGEVFSPQSAVRLAIIDEMRNRPK